MPCKNTIRNFKPHSYYHIYNRGINKQPVFLDNGDNRIFLSLFDRYLNSNTSQVDSQGNRYECYAPNVELQCYCLMGNHYHLLFHVGEDADELSNLMKAISTSYTSYANRKYKRVGSLFQCRFKSSEIQSDEHLMDISRYIHLNPRQPLNYEFSSIKSFLGNHCESWLNPKLLKAAIGDMNYFDFLFTEVA